MWSLNKQHVVDSEEEGTRAAARREQRLVTDSSGGSRWAERGVGIRLPVYATRDLSLTEGMKGIIDYCRAAEHLGFDSIWVIDHLLVAPALYATSWPDPLELLSVVATATETCHIGTAILVVPLWHPILLAKRIATLSSLTDGRFTLGIGVGWEAAEFAALGLRHAERGKRADEVIAAMKRLWAEESVSFAGEFFSFQNITIEPRLANRPEIWIAGGSTTRAKTGDPARLAKPVKERILQHEAWMSHGGGTDFDAIARDWSEIRQACAEVGRKPPLFSHTQWVHIVDSTDEDIVRSEQISVFRRVMGDTRSESDLRASYLFGTVDQILEQVRSLRELGVEHLIVNPVLPDRRQLELVAKHIMGSWGG